MFHQTSGTLGVGYTPVQSIPVTPVIPKTPEVLPSTKVETPPPPTMESAPPPSHYDRNYFTVGSTKDEVLAVQGTPTEITDYEFRYGNSKVSPDQQQSSRWIAADNRRTVGDRF